MFSALLALAFAQPTNAASIDKAIAQVERMPWEPEVTQIAQKHGLDVVNVTWEDTGRSKGSSMGPNISDMTIGVRDSSGNLHPMPVFRFSNFTDVTADLSSSEFLLPIGNAWGDEDLEAVSLADVLKDTRRYLHDGRSWAGRSRGLWDARDQDVLVSAQACFLPVPKAGEATFTPVLYNYQSSPDNPAVLTIVASRQGTSIQIIENDGGYMSEPLFFNQDGERAPFTAARLSDVRAGGIDVGPGGPVSAAGEDSSNVVLVVQVPLKHEPRNYGKTGGGSSSFGDDMMKAAPMSPSRASSNVENAVIGHGAVEGPYKEIDGLDIERDRRFPVRVTVQFYKATSNGVVTDADVADIRRQIDRVYADSNWVGSLVTAGYAGRPTEWVEAPTARASWAAPTFHWLKAF